MSKFEYKTRIIELHESIDDVANKFGAEGWQIKQVFTVTKSTPHFVAGRHYSTDTKQFALLMEKHIND